MKYMKKAWHAVFGAPRKATPEEVVLFNKYIKHSCERCHTTFNQHAWNSFTLHLIYDHGVDHMVAYQITSDLGKRFMNKYKEQGRQYENLINNGAVSIASESASYRN